MSVAEVLAKLRQLGGKLVEVTGGEPLLQQEVYPLTDHLLADGYRVLVETSGERSLAQLPRQVVKVLDVKCPGSGEEGKFCFDNLACLERKDQIKFVILNEDDYHYARGFLARHDLHRHVDEVIFSPVFDQLPPRSLAAWILRDGLEVRLGLQLHKFIWGTEARGV
jgi:7-carboxy-7-deazaguanine synthase